RLAAAPGHAARASRGPAAATADAVPTAACLGPACRTHRAARGDCRTRSPSIALPVRSHRDGVVACAAGHIGDAAHRRRAPCRPPHGARVARVRWSAATARVRGRALYADRRGRNPVSGIAGVFRVDGGLADAALVARMASALAHRGPDGEACGLWGPIGLAHRRLASAVEHAKPPLTDTDGRALVVDGRLD